MKMTCDQVSACYVCSVIFISDNAYLDLVRGQDGNHGYLTGDRLLGTLKFKVR